MAGQGNNCYEITEKDGYYKDENGTWSRCYDTCTKCNKGGDSSNHNCLQCVEGYHFFKDITSLFLMVNYYVLKINQIIHI